MQLQGAQNVFNYQKRNFHEPPTKTNANTKNVHKFEDRSLPPAELCNWPLREIGRECWPKAERGGSLDLVGAPILASKTFSQANSKIASQLKKKHIAKNTVSDISLDICLLFII